MNVVHFTPPSRFPTVVSDPGHWWSTVAFQDVHRLTRFSANHTFWRTVCHPNIAGMLVAGLSVAQRFRRRVEWAAHGLDLRQSALDASEALDGLCTPQPYRLVGDYIATVSRLAHNISTLNQAQSDLTLTLGDGVRVNGLNYSESSALLDYARENTLLSTIIRESIVEFPPDADVVLFSVTSPEDLLCAMIAARLMKERCPRRHLSLIDHGYENFSLQPHLKQLEKTGALTQIFDTIIENKDDRDILVPALVEAVSQDCRLRGVLSRENVPVGLIIPSIGDIAPSPVPTFAAEPVFWTRVSGRRCYWSRCTFCVHNNKYDDARAPSLSEVPAALNRIEQLIKAGYHKFIFSDEALSPALLRQLCRGIMQRGLEFRWACRCKMELTHSLDLFRLMAAAGCYEVLYGLESISTRMQKLMDKHTEGLDAARVRETLRWMHQAGIGAHVNLIGAFPGDTPAEVTESVEFLIEALRDVDNATFLVNRFALFPETPIAKHPEAFGVERLTVAGDMPTALTYRLVPELARQELEVDCILPELRQRLLAALGWSDLTEDEEGLDAAISLYFGSGHGSLFKTRFRTAFANPRRDRTMEGCP